MIVNVWIGLRDDAQAAIVTRLNWDEETQGVYTGPVTDRQAKVFSGMADRATVQRIFRTDTDGGRVWTAWSVYFNESSSVLQKVQDEIDQLALDYPAQFRIGGAFHFDGRQVGTQFVIEDVTRDIPDPAFMPPSPQTSPETEAPLIQVTAPEITGVTGTPTYPVHPRLIELMPDVDDIGTRPTELSDVNLLQGQTERRFVD